MEMILLLLKILNLGKMQELSKKIKCKKNIYTRISIKKRSNDLNF